MAKGVGKNDPDVAGVRITHPDKLMFPEPERFTVTSTPAYLKRGRIDPWRDYVRSKQRLKLPA